MWAGFVLSRLFFGENSRQVHRSEGGSLKEFADARYPPAASVRAVVTTSATRIAR
jgi:hypothetical protein